MVAMCVGFAVLRREFDPRRIAFYSLDLLVNYSCHDHYAALLFFSGENAVYAVASAATGAWQLQMQNIVTPITVDDMIRGRMAMVVWS